MTLKDFFVDLANSLSSVWLAEWWPFPAPSSLIVATPGGVWDAKSPDALCPPNIVALGWSGASTNGHLAWVGWDLDVGHGSEQYKTTDLALSDAFRIRDFLAGRAEVRLSKSGRGVHVRHRLPKGLKRPARDGPRIAKAVASALGLKADSSALGRQAFWFWSNNSAPNAFRLIYEHGGIAI